LIEFVQSDTAGDQLSYQFVTPALWLIEVNSVTGDADGSGEVDEGNVARHLLRQSGRTPIKFSFQ
jgi:hypothetical protein